MGSLFSIFSSSLPPANRFPHRPPNVGDSRSPCPVLNTLANHGYIRRDGKNISSQELQIALQEKMGLSWAATKSIITVALGQCGHEGHIDLDALSEHNKIEHDASLSRADAFLSGRHQADFNPSRFAKLLSFSKDGVFLTSDDLAEARAYFVTDSKLHNPEFDWSGRAEYASMIETSILLNVLGRDGRITLQDARTFFVEERFPDGWEKPSSYGLWTLNKDRSKNKKLFEAHMKLRGESNIHSASHKDY